MRRTSGSLKSLVVGSALALGLSCGASTALGQVGQQPVKIEPPTVTGKSEEGQAWGIFGIFVLMLLVVGASIIPTKRGHQD